MKKSIILIRLILFLSIGGIRAHCQEPPENSAIGALLMEMETGRVLYEKNPHQKMPMASTTKIMTAILALENSHLSDKVRVSSKASGVEGSSLYLAIGEELTMEELLYGLMLRSGNDAAAAIAEHIGESIEGFSKMMNEKACEIGAMNTNFMNPHGLHHEEHYTTAYDLALISTYAMKNSTFRQIASTKYYKIPWEGQPWDRVLMNNNALLWEYGGANGIKTGYTKAARRCLASAAIKDDMQLIAVVLNCQPWFDDSAAILDYGFSNYEIKKLFSREEIVGNVPVEDGFSKIMELALKDDILVPLAPGEEESLKIILKHPESLKAPIMPHTRIGSMEISIGEDFKIFKDIYTTSAVKENTFPSNLRSIIRQWAGGIR